MPPVADKNLESASKFPLKTAHRYMQEGESPSSHLGDFRRCRGSIAGSHLLNLSVVKEHDRIATRRGQSSKEAAGIPLSTAASLSPHLDRFLRVDLIAAFHLMVRPMAK
jgi:hypothetical protein